MPPANAYLLALPKLWKSLDRDAQRIANLISVPAGLDSCLATVCYTSLLLNNILPKRQRNIDLGALYGILEDTRIFTRLLGLLDLYATARESYAKQHRDPIIKVLLWASLVSGTAFQVLENVAFLVQKSVLRGGWLRSKENALWLVSNRFWLSQLLLELARLLRVRQLRFKKEFGAEKQPDDDEPTNLESASSNGSDPQSGVNTTTNEQELRDEWQQQLYITAACIPLVAHWSFEEGKSPINNVIFAACGAMAGFTGLVHMLKQHT